LVRKLKDAEDVEMLSELRNGWLADFETAALIPPPKSPSHGDRLRDVANAIAEGFCFWFGRLRELTSIATTSEEEPSNAVPAAPAPSDSLAQCRPVMPAGPFAPTVSEEVLKLRSGWLADLSASPERHAPKPVSWSTKLRREFQPISDEFAYWSACLKDFVLRAKTPRAMRRQTIRGERARRAEAAGRFISAGFVFAVCLGTVVYVAAVVHIFNPRHLAKILGQ
jgi:hypothetical protein